MNDNNNLEQVKQLIERLEKDFKDLKLAVRKIKEDTTTATRTARAPNQRTTQELEIGCKAKITNNIRPFQERERKMLADFFTKPLQGSLFRKFRDYVLGYVPDQGYVPVMSEVMSQVMYQARGGN